LHCRVEFEDLKAKYEALLRERELTVAAVTEPVATPHTKALKKRSAVVLDDSADDAYRPENNDDDDDDNKYVPKPTKAKKAKKSK
jgi:hypothetical protein